MIETKATYDDGFYSGESSEEEDYSSDEDSNRQQDYVDSLPKDKLKRYVQNTHGIQQIKKSLKIEDSNIPANFGTANRFSPNSTKTKMTALAKSIDLRSGWTQFH